MASQPSSAIREGPHPRDRSGLASLTDGDIYDEERSQTGSTTRVAQINEIREGTEVAQNAAAGESNINSVDNAPRHGQETPISVPHTSSVVFQNHASDSGRQMNFGSNYGHINIHYQSDGAALLGDSYPVGSGQSARRFLDLTERVATIDEEEREILKAKYLLENGRSQVQTLMLTNRYSPYAMVINRRVKSELRRLAHRFKFLDRCFAEYFRLVVPSFGREYVLELLADARNGIQRSMTSGTDPSDHPERTYVGDLGEFCEAVSRAWDQPETQPPKFTIRAQSDEEVWYYLQDAFEVPYWQFMLRLLARWQAHADSPSGQIVNHFLSDVRKTLSHGRQRLNETLEHFHDDKEGIVPILGGIESRISTLESLCPATVSNIFDDDILLSSPAAASESKPQATEQRTDQDPARTLNKSTETAVLIAMVLGFLIAAIIPGYKAFSISMQTKGPGSIEDADFYYLIQASIMAVLGNLVMVVPLLGRYWFSPAYWLMWLFFVAGLIFALLSIILYPLCNTGWSSLVSFIGNICSASSVLVMTQANANQARKAKQD